LFDGSDRPCNVFVRRNATGTEKAQNQRTRYQSYGFHLISPFVSV